MNEQRFSTGRCAVVIRGALLEAPRLSAGTRKRRPCSAADRTVANAKRLMHDSRYGGCMIRVSVG